MLVSAGISNQNFIDQIPQGTLLDLWNMCLKFSLGLNVYKSHFCKRPFSIISRDSIKKKTTSTIDLFKRSQGDTEHLDYLYLNVTKCLFYIQCQTVFCASVSSFLKRKKQTNKDLHLHKSADRFYTYSLYLSRAVIGKVENIEIPYTWSCIINTGN